MSWISLAELGTCDEDFTQDQALIAVGLAAISSDGDATDAEVPGLLAALARLGVGDSDEDRENRLGQIARLARDHGLRPVVGTALRALVDGRGEDALRLAFAILMVDGDIPDDELRFIGELQHALRISDDRYDVLLAEA